MHQRIGIPLLVAAFALTFPSPAARACACGMQPLRDAFARADVVFVGRVVELSERTVDSEEARALFGGPAPLLVAGFEVEEAFKGVGGTSPPVSPGYRFTSCTAQLEVGRRYVVFARRGAGGELFHTNSCDPTAPVEARPEVVAYARAAARLGKAPNIFGIVREGPEGSGRGPSGGARPAAGVGFVLKGEGYRFEAVSDADGAFALADVPPGSYVVRLRDSDRRRVLWWGGSSGEGDRLTVELEPDGTVELTAVVTGAEPSGGAKP
jgi:hypothetical protein